MQAKDRWGALSMEVVLAGHKGYWQATHFWQGVMCVWYQQGASWAQEKIVGASSEILAGYKKRAQDFWQ